MTNNDDFTRAAWAEVKRRTRPPGISGQTVPSMEQDAERDGYRRGFMDAAEWARAHLAAQEPTDAEAIAYLAAFVEDLPPGAGDDWTPDTIARVKRGLRATRRDEEKQDD